MGQGINRIATYEVPDASNHSVSIGTEKNSNVNSKFDEASLAAKREKVEQWRKIKMEELKAEKVVDHLCLIFHLLSK